MGIPRRAGGTHRRTESLDAVRMLPLQFIEPTLRKGKTKHDSEHDGACDLDGFRSVGEKQFHVIHNKIIRGIVDAGARN